LRNLVVSLVYSYKIIHPLINSKNHATRFRVEIHIDQLICLPPTVALHHPIKNNILT